MAKESEEGIYIRHWVLNSIGAHEAGVKRLKGLVAGLPPVKKRINKVIIQIRIS